MARSKVKKDSKVPTSQELEHDEMHLSMDEMRQEVGNLAAELKAIEDEKPMQENTLEGNNFHIVKAAMVRPEGSRLKVGQVFPSSMTPASRSDNRNPVIQRIREVGNILVVDTSLKTGKNDKGEDIYEYGIYHINGDYSVEV